MFRNFLIRALAWTAVVLFPIGCNVLSKSPSSQTSLMQGAPKPFGITGVVSTGSALVVSWSESEGASSYSLYRADGSRTDTVWGKIIATVKRKLSLQAFTLIQENATSPYTDSSVTPGQSYTYTVVASGFGGTTESVDGIIINGEPTAAQESAQAGPPAPGTFTMSATGGNAQVAVSWTTASDAASYTLKRGISSGTYGTTLTSTGVSPYTDTTVSNGTTYYYMVTATNATASTNASGEASATPMAPPGAFTISSAIPTTGKITVAWGTSANATSYTARRGISSGTYGTTLSTNATSPFLDTSGLTNGQTYYYMISGVNSTGTTNATAEVSATAYPGSFAISSVTPGSSQLSVAWGTSAGATSYTLRRGTSSGTYGTTVSTSATSPYVNSGLTAGQTYYYMVTANNAGGSVDADAEASGTVLPGSFTISSAAAGNESVDLSWGTSAGATSYIARYGTSTGTYGITASTNATSPLTISSLTNGTTYYFMVTAVNAGGTTNATAEANATPVAGPPGAFTIASTTAGNGQVTVAWNPASGASSYALKYGVSSGTYGTTFSTAATSPLTVTSLTNGTTYYFMVTATNGSGSTDATSEASAMPVGPPGAFTMAAVPPADTKLTVSWNTSAFASAYTLKRGLSSGTYGTIISTSAVSPYIDTGLTNGVTYYYMVTARNGAGTTDATAEKSGTPQPYNIIIGDYSGRRVTVMGDNSGSNVSVFGTTGTGANQFNSALYAYVGKDGRFYVSDYLSNRVARFDDLSGTNWITIGSSGTGVGQLSGPFGVALDSQDRIYVANYGSDKLVRFDDMSGTNWVSYGTYGTTTGRFNNPAQVNLDSSGKIYIADSGNNRIVRMDDMNGTNWVSYGTQGSGVGQFHTPFGVWIDSAGKIYVGDGNNQRIVRMDDMSGTNWVTIGTVGGVPMNYPWGVCVTPAGKIYVMNTNSQKVMSFDDMTGSNPQIFGTTGTGVGEFTYAYSIYCR